MSAPTNWIPPALVGAAMVVVAELALGLLLFDGPGFLRALTVILVVEAVAFSLGISAVPRTGSASRGWRWYLCAGALLLAGGAALLWGIVEQVPAGWPRGVALTLFAALPMYTFGLVFAGMGGVREGRERAVIGGIPFALPRRRRGGSIADRRAMGAPAALGVAGGALLFGYLLLPRLAPVSIYMFALLCISMAAMVEGSRSQLPSRGSAPSGEDRSAAESSGSGPSAPDEGVPDEGAPDEEGSDEAPIPSIADFAPDPPEGPAEPR